MSSLSCSRQYSLKKNIPESIRSLQAAFERGFDNYYDVLTDEDLNNIRSSKDYDAMVKKYIPQKSIDQVNELKKKAIEEAKSGGASTGTKK